MKVLILDVAGREFVKRVVKLQKSIKHTEAKSIIGTQLIDGAIDAGARCSETQLAALKAKRSSAIKADEAVKRTLFLLDVMQAEGYITERNAAPVRVLGWEIINTLRVYIDNVFYAEPKAPHHAPVPMHRPAPAPRPEHKVQPIVIREPADDDGFYDDYSSEV